MALSELSAFEAAYEVLQPLDDAGRRRALQWLTDVLGDRRALARTVLIDGSAAAELQEATPPSKVRRASKRTAAPVDRVPKLAPGAKKRGRPRAVAEAVPSLPRKRVRRPMPSTDEIMAAYEQVGTISGLADHFNVPTHTVYSWSRTLRSRGYDIGRAR